MSESTPAPHEPVIGLALSGGGARAIAFHLGCLRALHDRGILERVRVISAVSGGAVIASLYAYFDESFEDFDQRISLLLRRGLLRDIVAKLLEPRVVLGALGTSVFAGLVALGADGIRAVVSNLAGVAGHRRIGRLGQLQPPLQRWVSRSTAFEDAMRALVGDLTVASPRREGIDVVINACDLRSGAAFRFGSQESACWRYGKVGGEPVPLSLAIAASAAYPVLLPALDKQFDFTGRDGRTHRHRVLLTDGGVYNNLGTSCLEPGRSADYSSNVFPADYIICCDAGQGLFDAEPIPYWWGPRLSRAFQNVFRRVQNGTQKRLHDLVADGSLRGFVLSYLG